MSTHSSVGQWYVLAILLILVKKKNQFPDGREQPIALASRSLSPSECNYVQIEKEALSLIFGVRKFHQYLYGKSFVLVTDHKCLTTLLVPKTGIPTLVASRMQRWGLILSAYSYTIEYRVTNNHGELGLITHSFCIDL